ncbi:MAG: hypothetical protein P4M08_15825 [Oligoflexia bacterium]|nr:hypothetical protein [Oligoflexia bacterium]
MKRKNFVTFALFSVLFCSGTAAFSDSQVNPPGGSWGDPSEANKMLQMTRDPDVVRSRPPTPEELDHRVPAKVKNCSDGEGRPIDGTVEGQGCSISGGPSVNPASQSAPRSRSNGQTGAGGSASQGISIGQ